MGLFIKEGMPGSRHIGTDSRAVTVVKVIPFKTGKRKGQARIVVVRDNKVKCKDWYAGEYEIFDELEDGERYYSLRKEHSYVEIGGNCEFLTFGSHYHYIDPCF